MGGIKDMAWQIVKQPNGKYARFADPVDDFTHYDMTRDEAVELCRDYLGRQDAIDKVQRADDDPVRFLNELKTIESIRGAAARADRERELSRLEETDPAPQASA